jgi:hypothetical protein
MYNALNEIPAISKLVQMGIEIIARRNLNLPRQMPIE